MTIDLTPLKKDEVRGYVPPWMTPVVLRPGDPGYEDMKTNPVFYNPPPEVIEQWRQLLKAQKNDADADHHRLGVG